jgi:amino acid adenylation domain-containing protein
MAGLYAAQLNDEQAKLPELPIQYADYALWQQEWLRDEELETQLAYWRQQLGGEIPVLEVPADYSRPLIQTFRGARQSCSLSPKLSQALNELSQQAGATLFMTLLAAFKLLLYRYTGQVDVIIGSPIAGRSRVEIEKLIGFFLNTLVLRTNLSGDPSFNELLSRVREVCLAAYANQDIPFEKILEELQPERDLSRTPMFQVFFNMLSFDSNEIELPGLVGEVIDRPDVDSNFDLTLYVQEQAGQISLTLVYNADLFRPERTGEMLTQYQHLLTQIVENPEDKLSHYSLVTDDAKVRLPNPAQVLSSKWYGSVHAAFTRQANRTPESIAVVDQRETWTYRELEAHSNQLAHYLCAKGIQPQDVVAIYGHRSASLIWAIMGALKAGAAFLILDPTYPTSRLTDYLKLAQPRGWLQIESADPPTAALQTFLKTLPCCCHLVLPPRTIVAEKRLLAEFPVDDPDVQVGPDDLAYLSFTSGSAGHPKGILGRHGSLTHFMPWQEQEFNLAESDRFSMLSGLAHDPLQRDIFTAFWVGARVCIPDPAQIGTPGWLVNWLQQEGVTITHLTPAMGQLIAETATDTIPSNCKTESLRYAFFVGDILNRRDVARMCQLAPNLTVVNFYGTTETQRAVSYYPVSTDVDEIQPANMHSKEIIPLGRGMPDAQLLVLNGKQQSAGVGEAGEIYVRSHHLALGYLGDETQTQRKFLANPFTGILGDRLYRTGDLGRYLPSGNVEFMGRADSQVKIRGFRVELGEIEAVLGKHPSIQEAVAIIRDDLGDSSSHLVAYVVLLPRQVAPTIGKLRSYLTARFPMYMVPSAFVFLSALPLTPNKKVDRRALPTPDAAHIKSNGKSVAPRNELEEKLVQIWEELLGFESVGVKDDFFELGGHSLLAVRLFAQIETVFGTNLPLVSLFQEATIEHLAAVIGQQTDLKPWSSLVAMQPQGSNRPFFCIHGITGDILWFRELAHCLAPNQPFYGIQARGLDGIQEPHYRIEEMASYYIEEMRLLQPEGPYNLGGASFGGTVAFEMAHQLLAHAQEVALLAILDHGPFNLKLAYSPGKGETLIRFLKNLPFWFESFIQLGPSRMFARFRRKIRLFGKALDKKFRLADERIPLLDAADMIDSAAELPEHRRTLIEAHYEAIKRYVSQPYPGEVTLFRARSRPLFSTHDPAIGWNQLAPGRVTVLVTPGSHEGMFKEPHVQQLAKFLKAQVSAK